MDEETLTELLRNRPSREGRRTRRCPDEDTMAAFLDGNAPPKVSRSVRKHVAECDFCLGHVAGAAEVEKAADDLVPTAVLAVARGMVAPVQPSPLRYVLRWSPAAAGIAVMLVAGIWLNRPPVNDQRNPAGARVTSPQMRSVPVDALTPEVTAPLEGADVVPGVTEIVWQELPGALFYEVEVVSSEGDVLWHQRFSGPPAQIPDTFQKLPERDMFLWVRSHLSDGKTLTSRPVGFRIERHP